MSAYIEQEEAFRGIGANAARKLFAAYGGELYGALTECGPGVVNILGAERAIIAAAIMRERAAETEFVDAIDTLGLYQALGAQLTLRVARAWGPHGIEPVRTNPFNLLPLIGWKRASNCAARLGIGADDPRRITAAIEEVLCRALHRGDTMRDRIAVQRAAERIAGVSVGSEAVEACIASGGALALSDRLQSRGAGLMEAECALRLATLAQQRPTSDLGLTPANDAAIKAVLDRTEAAIAIRLTRQQREAVLAAHRHRILVVAGYAGSGKTTVLRAICDTLEASGRVTQIMALTGRAAQKAKEATGREAVTIAGFVAAMDRDKREALGAEAVVIVDEASMLSLVDAWRILRRIGSAQLILVGDPAQLPPIGFGLVFHVLAETDGMPRVTLDRVLRQRADTGIPVVAESIRFGRIPALNEYERNRPGVSLAPCLPSDALAVIDRIRRDLASDPDISESCIQIISPIHGGEAGVSAINGHYHTRMVGTGAALWPWPCDRDPRTRPRLAVGDPVMWTQNDRERGFTNGSLGYLYGFADGRALARIDERNVVLDPDKDHEKLVLAYCLTVHKAQGSAWPAVIIPVFGSSLLDRSLIYTAVTRARRQVILVGDQEAFCDAVTAQPKALRRRVGFRTWLGLATGGEH